MLTRRAVAGAVTLMLPGALRAQSITQPAPSVAPTAPAIPGVTQPTPLLQPTPNGQHSAGQTASAAQRPIDRTKTYYVFFDQVIDASSMRGLRRQCAALIDAGVSDIVLVMNSSGGNVEEALVTYTFLRALPARVAAHAQGVVASAATLLFLAADHRTADETARFVFHPSQSFVNGSFELQQMETWIAASSSFWDVMRRLYRERTHLPDAQIDRFKRELVIYTAEEAASTGIVDDVVQLRMPADKSRILLLEP